MFACIFALFILCLQIVNWIGQALNLSLIKNYFGRALKFFTLILLCNKSW